LKEFSAEPTEIKSVNSEPSLKESFGELNSQYVNVRTLIEPASTCQVKTSAVTGTGLQELLALIDKKTG
jgi:translation initiation factor IF-2